MNDNAVATAKIYAGGTLTKPRNSNLELFRIITMLLIVAHHYVVNSGLAAAEGPIYSDPMSWRSIFLLLIGAWGKVGINCFVMITGYFMCKSQITAKKFAKLLGEVMFYRLVINAVFWLTGYAEFSLKGFVKLLIPVTTIGTGFVNAYLVFFLTIPFLNILIKNMSEKQHICLVLLCAFTYIFLGSIPIFSVTMNYVSWFIVVYFVASYIRLYPKRLLESAKLWGCMTLASLAVSAASIVAGAWIGAKIGRGMALYFVGDSNRFLAVCTAVCAFLFFKNLKPRYSSFINAVAASAFGVLLIHANSDTMRQWLWVDTLNNTGMYNSPWIIAHAITSVIAIYIVCTIVDQLRIRFIEIPLFKVWDMHWNKFLTWYKNLENKICTKLNIQEE